MNDHVAIGVPCGDMVNTEFAVSLAAMMYASAARYGIEKVSLINAKGSITAENRNRIVRQAQGVGARYLLFIDSDMQFPMDALNRLLVQMQDHGYEVLGCNYRQRGPPFGNLVRSLQRAEGDAVQEAQGVVEVERLPTGFMLIDMRVFDRLAKPYFKFLTSTAGDGGVYGEDYCFCDELRKMGKRIWMHTELSLELAHWGAMGVKWTADEKGYAQVY